MLSDKIKELQKKNGITQKDLAESLGISVTGLHKMFKNDDFKVSTLRKIASLLFVTPASLLSETSEISSNIKIDRSEIVKVINKFGAYKEVHIIYISLLNSQLIKYDFKKINETYNVLEYLSTQLFMVIPDYLTDNQSINRYNMFVKDSFFRIDYHRRIMTAQISRAIKEHPNHEKIKAIEIKNTHLIIKDISKFQ